MRAIVCVLASMLLVGCSPAGSSDNPRDRKGEAGALTWRSVIDETGQAAFLSRPGSAPDLVLWCGANRVLTLRAHVFEAPSAMPDLSMRTNGGIISFENVRRQGGVRAGDRKLVEGTVSLSDPKLGPILLAASDLTVMSGGATFQAKNADPANILPAFNSACAALQSNAKEKSR
jgi:hypothetical protein